MVILGDLSNQRKLKMLSGIPRKAKYLKWCLMSFWRLKLKPDADDEENYEKLGSMSVWHNPVLKINVDYSVEMYCKHKLHVLLFSDLIDKTTGRPFTWRNWRKFVSKMERERTGVRPDNVEVITRAEQMMRVQRQIPQDMMDRISEQPSYTPVAGDKVYIITSEQASPAIWKGADRVEEIWVDPVAVGHLTGKTLRVPRGAAVRPAQM